MASPCELLIDTQDEKLAKQLTSIAQAEVIRIEKKFSRYRTDNLLHQINHSQGQSVIIDDETYRLLQFANTCFELSDGMFDLSSGVLRKAWNFNGSDQLPSPELVSSLLPRVGWQRLRFTSNELIMPADMELDFGGIGKEYAVDCVAKLCNQLAPKLSVVVNFGGDIQVTCPRKKDQSWHIGIESLQGEDLTAQLLHIKAGGLATSGDARRFLLKNGKRYSHILNPNTGYPVEDAPRSVTVAASHCIQAGLLATLALLQGPEAEQFLQNQNVQFWCYR
ncbi:FAD:protein FMN transferase [Paraglaciecola sp. 25GB23A]|uniref:FAD:protein FMN transferase n=1 Tax=Paraglaciecola sp. 25GB23A TaxID=3156068 RepID=UPI0032AEF4AB